MEEYIKIPSYLVKDIRNINSIGMQQFFETVEYIDITEEKFDIKYLRDYYKEYPEKFVDLVDELAIRGFKFKTNKPNNLLHNIDINQEKYIFSSENSDYKEIEFDKFDLGNFINRFKIEKNNFFNLIPIEGFKVLNSNIDLIKLEDEFKKSKFNVSGFIEEVVDKSPENIQKEKCDVDISKYDLMLKEDFDDNYKIGLTEDIELANAFSESFFVSVIKYMEMLDVKFVSEIENHMIIGYCRVPGVGSSKGKRFLKRLISLSKTYKHNYNIYSVDFWYSNNNFKGFREFCKNMNIKKVDQINKMVLMDFYKISKISKKEIIEIETVLDEYKSEINNIEALEVRSIEMTNMSGGELLSDIFNDTKHSSLLMYFARNKIISIQDITDDTIIDYCQSRGAGLAKIKNLKDKLIEYYLKNQNQIKLNYNIKSINFWFSDIDYNLFRSFCNLNNILNVSDISEDIFIDYPKWTKVSQVALNKIRKQYEGYKKYEFEENVSEVVYEIQTININEYWYGNIKHLSVVDTLNALEIESNMVSDYKIHEINGKDISELKLDEYKNEIYTLVNTLDVIKPLTEIFEGVDEKLEDNYKQILEYRYNYGYTLEQVGDIFNVTRERIRQLQKKAERKILNYFGLNKVRKAIALHVNGAKYCKIKDLYELTPKSKEYYIKILIKSSSKVFYLDKLNLLFLRDYKNIQSELEQLVNELPEVFKIYDYLDLIIEKLKELGIDEPEIEEVEELLINYGYKIYNQYSSKTRLTATQVVEIIFKEYIQVPIRFDEDGFNYVNNIAIENFNMSLGTNNRSIEGRIRDNQEIILVDKLTFININNFSFNRNVVTKIKVFLEDIFKEREVVNVSYVFEQNEEFLIKNGVKNKQALYSIIFYYFGEKYKAGTGNTLDIYRSHQVNTLSKLEILERIIYEHRGRIHKKKVCELTGWADFQVENCISDSDNMIKLDNEITYFSMLRITIEERKELKYLLDRLMLENGYTSSAIILREMKFNNILGQFISRNNITSNENIATIIKKFDSSLSGHTNLISKNTCPYKSIDDVVRGTFKGEFTRDEVREFIDNLGYKDMMGRNTVNKAIEDNVFVEISKDDLVHIDDYTIDNEAIEALKNYIKEQIEGKEYLILTDLIGYRRVLPSIDYRWNPYLMKSILVKNGYRVIKRVFDDIRSEKLILVRKDSKYTSYADLILDLIQNNYSGNMHEVKIYEFLEECGVVNKQDHTFDKKIPYDLKYIGKVKVDEFGRVEIL